ncbi:MAG: class I SAM-dependent methyltransferase, partial [Anaerolineae bacterium]
MNDPYVLSYIHTAPLLLARQAGEATTQTSLDLGLTTAEVSLEVDRVVLPDGQWLPWEVVEEITEDESACYAVQDSAVERIHRFSEVRDVVYVLMPTQRAPTVLVSGIQMHRVRDIDPWQDTLEKIRTLSPIQGRVLDTCTGLGYTAIAAAKTAQEVTTVELDPNMLQMARLNPWSRPLFVHPRIKQIEGDSYEEVERFAEQSFACIIHDPPMLTRAGELYSGEFYRRLHRVLKDRGRLYHYVGDPESRSGRNTIRGVIRRLREAGFGRVETRPRAFGVVAYK